MENNKRSILITGGTGKIGKVLVREMLQDGHQVVFTSTSAENRDMLLQEFSQFSSQLYGTILKFENVESINQWSISLPIKVDTIIHNARSLSSLKIGSDGFSDFDNIIKEISIAIAYPYQINKAVILNEHPLRDIIFISSMYGSVAPNKQLYDNFHRQSPIQYGIGKAAQIHTVKELAVRLAEKNIRVNAISFGGVEGRVNEVFKERYSRLNPSGKMLVDDDLYPAIQFLLKNSMLNITGENIKIDGGWTIW